MALLYTLPNLAVNQNTRSLIASPPNHLWNIEPGKQRTKSSTGWLQVRDTKHNQTTPLTSALEQLALNTATNDVQRTSTEGTLRCAFLHPKKTHPTILQKKMYISSAERTSKISAPKMPPRYTLRLSKAKAWIFCPSRLAA